MSPNSTRLPHAPATDRGRPRRRRVAGFTLLEAMLSTTIFTMVTLGVYTILIKSYQMIALSRCRDEARAVLRTYADQFLRLQTTERVSGATYNRWLFNPTNAATGRGLHWGELSDDNTSTPAEDVGNIAITLGTGGHATPARLTRDVRYVASATGANVNALSIDAAGFMLSATFAISYTSSGKAYTQFITVTRATP